MSRPFGWSLPPGAAGDPNAPWNQEEGPCAVCGKAVDDCICPECPTCGSYGDPDCYTKHGMVVTPEQVASLKAERESALSAEAAQAADFEKWQRECDGDGDGAWYHDPDMGDRG